MVQGFCRISGFYPNLSASSATHSGFKLTPLEKGKMLGQQAATSPRSPPVAQLSPHLSGPVPGWPPPPRSQGRGRTLPPTASHYTELGPHLLFTQTLRALREDGE